MKVKFWGCRGSIPRSHPDMVRYGGNTPCVEVHSSDGELRVVLDLGSGSYDLGQEIVRMGKSGPSKNVILITHTHWDHIQGLPFFVPLFIPGNNWDVYGPRGLASNLRETLSGQMEYEYFPVTMEMMGADVRYHDLIEGTFWLGDEQGIKVRAQYLNHPALTLGYCLEDANTGIKVLYVTDHEPFDRNLAAEGYKAMPEESNSRTADDRHANFVAGADLLIHDCQYTADEYVTKKKATWGHSTVEYVVDIAIAGGVRNLAIFHHDPLRTDDQIDKMVELAKKRAKEKQGPNTKRPLHVFGAADRQEVQLEMERNRRRSIELWGNTSIDLRDALKKDADEAAWGKDRVLLFFSSSEAAAMLKSSLNSDGLEVDTCYNFGDALDFATSKKPSVIVVEGHVGNSAKGSINAISFCGHLRQMGPWGETVPILVTSRMQEEVESNAGVSGWIVEPYTEAYARTRVRMSILGSPCLWSRPALPPDEDERLETLLATGLLDTDPEERFDRITRIAGNCFQVPIVLISMVDEDRQWFKSCASELTPLGQQETPRDQAFCAHAILKDEIFLIPDAHADERFADNPLVTGEPYVRFYAGCPLTLKGKDGNQHRIGTLCLIDHRPRDLNEMQRKTLRDMAKLVEEEIARTM